MKTVDLLGLTESYMANKVRLPVVREEFFWPTEASVELDEKYPGEPNVIGTCMRAAYYRYIGGFTGDPYTAYNHWTFAIGHALEAHLRETWKQIGIWIDNSVKFRSAEKHISGEMDVVLMDIYTKKPFICEVKSYYGYDATKNLKGNPKKGILGAPKDPHLMQICIYLDLHKHLIAENKWSPYGKLIYLDKVGKDNVEFTIELKQEGSNTFPVVNGLVSRKFSVEQIYERFEKLYTYIEQKILPPRDYELEFSPERIEREFVDGNISKTKYEAYHKKGIPIGSWNCSYCKFKTECYGKDSKDIPVQIEE